MVDYIRNGDFCFVVSDKFIDEGVKRNHIVFVAGHKALPITENDPYTQRIKFLVNLVNNDHIDSSRLYLMDPNSILKVEENKQKHLDAIRKEDFDKDESTG